MIKFTGNLLNGGEDTFCIGGGVGGTTAMLLKKQQKYTFQFDLKSETSVDMFERKELIFLNNA